MILNIYEDLIVQCVVQQHSQDQKKEEIPRTNSLQIQKNEYNLSRFWDICNESIAKEQWSVTVSIHSYRLENILIET
jgi:hypothetical protein